MNKLCHFFLLTYLCFLIFSFTTIGDASDQQVYRQKRYLAFQNISHFFFRVNFRNNVVPWTQLFAEALGYRINWNEPPDSFRLHHISRRSVYRNMEILLERIGLDSNQCIRRIICETNNIDQPKTIYHKILKMVFRQNTTELEKWSNNVDEDCESAITTCPFSLLDVSLYTDI